MFSFRSGVRSSPPPLRFGLSGLLLLASSSGMAWGHGVLLPRQGRRCGGDFAMGFWCSSSSASARRSLRRRQEEGARGAGAMAARLLGLAAGWWMPWSVQVLWSAVVRSGAAPRRRRLGRPDLEVEGELGVRPRAAHHSDMWASVLLIGFTKPFGDGASSSSGLVVFVLLSGGAPASAASGGLVPGGADDPVVSSVVLLSFRGLPAVCTGPCILLGRISVCTYVVLHLSTT